MAYLSERSWIPVPPPGEDDLPCDDGEPMETERHRNQMNILIDTLNLAWKDRDDFYAGGNMFVYFSELQAKKNDFRGPDVFVVLDTTRRERKSWVVWQENGRTPDVIIELLSESTEHIDRGEKMRLYANTLHVSEYYLYDPITRVLEGFVLDPQKVYYPLKPDVRGDLPCTRLGLRLGRRPTRYGTVVSNYLRWIDTHDRPLPTAEELAVLAEEHARSAEEHARSVEEQAKAAMKQAHRAKKQMQSAQEKAQASKKQVQSVKKQAQSAEQRARAAEQELEELRRKLAAYEQKR